MDIRALHKQYENCPCGKAHACPIDTVLIGSGVIETLNSLCKDYGSILLVSDENTYRAAGMAVASVLGDRISEDLVLSANGDVVIPNEEKIAELEAKITADTDLIIGVGSGVINDLCKHVSFLKDLPYFIVATAPSMDGYASVGAALILGGMKVTLNARPPKAIIADTKVLKDAPMDMLRAGYGDIIGKYSCLNDWKLSALIRGEYFCGAVYDMTYAAAQKTEKLAEGIVARDEASIGALMEALVTVGIAMSFVDCSRPASGSEHHLSHFFEITGILDGKAYFAHGIDVAYSSVLTARLREELLQKEPFEKPFDRNEWEANIKRIYSSSADGVIALQDKLGWYERREADAVLPRVEKIKAILKEAPTANATLQMLERVGLRYEAFIAMYGEEKIADAIRYAKDLKDRYSVLWLADLYF